VSRGLGKTQQFLESQLADGHWHDIGWLAYRLHDHKASAAELESIRRAVRTLAARGIVESRRMNIGLAGDPLEVRLKPGRRKPRLARAAEPIDPDELETLEQAATLNGRQGATHRRSRTSGRTLCGLETIRPDGTPTRVMAGRTVSVDGKVTCKRCLGKLAELGIEAPGL
jgi:hypothetical protein